MSLTGLCERFSSAVSFADDGDPFEYRLYAYMCVNITREKFLRENTTTKKTLYNMNVVFHEYIIFC